MPVDLTKIKYRNLGFFNFKKLKGKYLLTNDVGCFAFLTEKEFESFLAGKLKKDEEPYLSLAKGGFVKNDMDARDLIEKYALKHDFLKRAPALHIVVVTLRCTNRCIYCHASAQDMTRRDLDMTKKTAQAVVDTAFQSPDTYPAIEFQGGEPLAAWPVVKFMAAYARKRNRKIKKDLQIRLVSNMSLMDEDKFKYLIRKKVALCTSLDGPEKLHNKVRPLIGGNSYRQTVKWIRKFNKVFPKLTETGYIWKIGALSTITRPSLKLGKEMVDEYVKLGLESICLRPLNPFGFSRRVWQTLTYSPKEFLDFYRKTLTYIIELNLKGVKIRESLGVFLLKKIFSERDPNDLDHRSPCGAGISQLAYNYNGDVYTCDEGRMFSMMGDESFRLGNVLKNTYAEIVGSPVTRTMCTASCLESVPGCSDCAYKPYCGTCPLYNYFAQGSIFGQMPSNERCQINMGMLDTLFTKLQNAQSKKVLLSWLE